MGRCTNTQWAGYETQGGREFLLRRIKSPIVFGCHENTQGDVTISPEAGSSYKAGTAVALKIHYGNNVHPDSIVYYVDSIRIGVLKDSSLLSLKTDSLSLGNKTITAKLYWAGKSHDVSSNIVLFAAKPPEEMAYKVQKVFPHDTSAYTEGLVYENGFLYEKHR